ncbi:MAG: CysB family HTH-type transcriptional regulator [Burkholderiales bacterium]
MNLQQLRYVREVARRGLNVSEAAKALHTSQPGVSQQVQAFEQELGVAVFVRTGRRLSAVTEAGREVLDIVERVLAELANLGRVGEEFAAAGRGSLAVAVTHTQARYALPPVVSVFMKRFPKVRLKLLQGNPHQLARWVLDGEADVAIATEALDRYEALVTVPGYQWHHGVVVPSRHPLARAKAITLEAIAKFPIVTYDATFAGRSAIDAAFARRGLAPDIVLTALDSDVIKSYVSLGLGVGLVSSVAFDRAKDKGLVLRAADHLFPVQTTRLAFRKGAWLRGYTKEFIRLFVPHLSREALEGLAAGRGEDFSI